MTRWRRSQAHSVKLAIDKEWEVMDGEPQIWKTQKVTLVHFSQVSYHLSKHGKKDA